MSIVEKKQQKKMKKIIHILLISISIFLIWFLDKLKGCLVNFVGLFNSKVSLFFKQLCDFK